MAKVLDSVTLIAPTSDPDKQEGENFTMSMSYAVTGGGKPPDVNLYWQYRYDGTFYAIPISANGLYTDSNEEIDASKDTQYDRAIECNTEGVYYVRARAYDTTNSIEKTSDEQIVTVNPAGPTPNEYNKILYTSEPPTPNAWNQVKQEAGTGWRKLLYV